MNHIANNVRFHSGNLALFRELATQGKLHDIEYVSASCCEPLTVEAALEYMIEHGRNVYATVIG